jgi:thiosulfate/3-mercaptopyruvate sulfurtransferase
MPGHAPVGPLIDRDELAALLASPHPPALLDVRYVLGGPPGIDSYLAGHIPGACYIDLDTELAGPPGDGGRHPLPDPEVFGSAMRRAGLHVGQLAVVYDDADATCAARLWWMLRYHGHRLVLVLDGGYRGWAGAGLPVTSQVPRPEPGDFQASAQGLMPVLSTEEAGRLARSGFLLDARAGVRYRGEVEPVDAVAGHIPGAISVPTAGNAGPDGTFLPVEQLANRFAALGLPMPEHRLGGGDGGRGGPDGGADVFGGGADVFGGGADVFGGGADGGGDDASAGGGGAPVIGAYCGSGVTAAHEVLALELVGLSAALYVGSWSAWSADPTRPVATGPEPG